MKSHADKNPQNNSRTTARAELQYDDSKKLPFVDNRSGAIVQRKLKMLANNSEQVTQLKIMETKSNNCHMAEQTRLNQLMANTYSKPKHLGTPTASPNIVQRATVAGVRNDTKSATEIGDDMHAFVQGLFLQGSLPRYLKLYKEFSVGAGRADIVAMKIESEDDGNGGEYVVDQEIYVGEIKPDSSQYQADVRGAGASQLANYMQLFRTAYPQARVGNLDFWNPPTDGQSLGGNGYNSFIYIRNARNGMYYYKGRVTEQHSYAANDGSSDSEVDEPLL